MNLPNKFTTLKKVVLQQWCFKILSMKITDLVGNRGQGPIIKVSTAHKLHHLGDRTQGPRMSWLTSSRPVCYSLAVGCSYYMCVCLCLSFNRPTDGWRTAGDLMKGGYLQWVHEESENKGLEPCCFLTPAVCVCLAVRWFCDWETEVRRVTPIHLCTQSFMLKYTRLSREWLCFGISFVLTFTIATV